MEVFSVLCFWEGSWRGLYIMVSCRLFRPLLVRIGEGKRNCESELISMS